MTKFRSLSNPLYSGKKKNKNMRYQQINLKSKLNIQTRQLIES